MKKYNEGDNVIITGHAKDDDQTAHYLLIGCRGIVVREIECDPGFYEVEGTSATNGRWISQTLHHTEFMSATTHTYDRPITQSEGSEGETFYRFNHTEGSSI